MVYQEDEDSVDESDHGILESKDEPDNKTAVSSSNRLSEFVLHSGDAIGSNEFNRTTQMEVDAIEKMRSYLTDLSKDMIIDSDQINTKLNEFTQLLREENPSTNEEMEGLINKFICDL